ncbi:MAG: lipid A biosynthesis acyltransferase [Oleiphilus sp.]|nr:MAG: lipid A biosynthesis acyltransferase [Oleiphilus sp.]
MTARDLDYRHYFGVRYWPTWILLGICKLVSILPLRIQYTLGSITGALAYRVLKRRRHITEINLAACFPEMDGHARQQLVRQSFRSNAIGLIEALRSWYASPSLLEKQVRFHGLEHLDQALERGKGVILLGGHYSTLDLAGSLTTLVFEADVMHRGHSNPLFNAFMTRSRQRLYGAVISKDNVRQMLRRLRQNRIVWYATDQDYGRNNTVFVPFFGVPCSTLVSTMKLAKASGAAVIPFSHFRRDKSGGYDIYFEEALTDFPGEDLHHDAERLNKILEANILKAPEQYLWMHRRFKTCPDPDAINLYGQRSK